MCFGSRRPKIKRRNIHQTIFLLLILVIINLSEAIVEQMFVILYLLVSILIILLIIHLFKKNRNRKLLKSATGLRRGTRSERKLILKLLKLGILTEAIFHDLYLQKPNGEYSQIDLVAVVDAGIIVFEVKDYSGWLFGSVNQYKWTQVLAYGNKKYRFYNPIKQNSGHINALKSKLKHLGNISYHSVVLFDGDCEIKALDSVPNSTFVEKFNQLPYILKEIDKSGEYLSFTIRDQVSNILKDAVINGENIEVKKQHIDNVRKRTETR